jgi:hypothetical protein
VKLQCEVSWWALRVNTDVCMLTWEIRQRFADSRDLAYEALKCRVGSTCADERAVRTVELKTGQDLDILCRLLVLDGEGVRLNDLLAIAGFGMDRDQESLEVACFEGGKGALLLLKVSTGHRSEGEPTEQESIQGSPESSLPAGCDHDGGHACSCSEHHPGYDLFGACRRHTPRMDGFDRSTGTPAGRRHHR